MGKFTVAMEQQKETKNTIKFQELVGEGEEERIGQQYVQKSAFEGASPRRITITAEW